MTSLRVGNLTASLKRAAMLAPWLFAPLLALAACREYAPVATEIRKETAPSQETPTAPAPTIEPSASSAPAPTPASK
ncbi:MAG: hypothetical protein HOW73_02835 [Polyangiaceae bacterium]|nr:hypothetical protein [Polyangiaceae bacterium]